MERKLLFLVTLHQILWLTTEANVVHGLTNVVAQPLTCRAEEEEEEERLPFFFSFSLHSRKWSAAFTLFNHSLCAAASLGKPSSSKPTKTTSSFIEDHLPSTMGENKPRLISKVKHKYPRKRQVNKDFLLRLLSKQIRKPLWRQPHIDLSDRSHLEF